MRADARPMPEEHPVMRMVRLGVDGDEVGCSIIA
jgi:hypothetical protein